MHPADRLESTLKKSYGARTKFPLNLISKMPCGKCAAPLRNDVNLQVVKDFAADVEAKAQGEPKSSLVGDLTSGLSKLSTRAGAGDGETNTLLKLINPTIVLGWLGYRELGNNLAKLALHLQKQNRSLMVATDVYRPAAIDQLVNTG